MAKKKKNKKRGKKSPFVFRAGVFCTIALDCGVTLKMRKTRSSRLQDMINATPVFQQTINFVTTVHRAVAQQVDLNTLDVPDLMQIPGHEIEQLLQFFADNTLDVLGAVDVDDDVLVWSGLPNDARLDFFEMLPPADLFTLYGKYLANMAADADPHMRKGIA